MPAKARSVDNLRHFTRFLHGPIPGQLSLRLSPGNFRTVPTGERVRRCDVAANERTDAEPDFSSPHVRKSNGPLGPIDLIGPSEFALADDSDRLRQVAIPFDGIHAEIKMSVENEHGGIPGGRHVAGMTRSC